MRQVLSLSFVAAALAAAPPAEAALSFTGSSGDLKASATFNIVGSQLFVTLANTSTSDVMEPVDVLTGVFFNLATISTLTRDSGLLGTGSSVVYDPDGQPVGGVIGGEWAFKQGLNQYGANAGISSAGLGIFAPSERFPGPNLAPPEDPDGLQYGLLSQGDDTATGNPKILSGGASGNDSGGLIKNSVVFALGGLPNGFALSDISKVTFQYGTALSEGHFQGTVVPEPSTYIAGALLAIPGILGLSRVARRRGIALSQ